MIFKYILIIPTLWTLINGSVYQETINFLNAEAIKIKNNTNMDFTERYMRLDALNKILKNVKTMRNSEKSKELELMNQKYKLESSIFKKYLYEKMGGSSFGMDFHTLRFI